MAFQLPYRTLGPEFVRAAETGLWTPVGQAVDRNFDELNTEMNRRIDELAAVVADLAATQAELTATVDILSSVVVNEAPGLVSTTSTTFVALSGGPSVTFTAAGAGRVILWTGSWVAGSSGVAAIVGGDFGISLDGGAAFGQGRVSMGTNSGNESIQANTSRAELVTLSLGNHTAEMQYRTIASTQGCDFSSRFIIAMPLVG